MYVIVRPWDSKIIGQSFEELNTETQFCVPVSKDLYEKFIASPGLYSKYRVSKSELTGLWSVVLKPKISKSTKRFVQVLQTLAVSPCVKFRISKYLTLETYGLDPDFEVSVFGFADCDYSKPVMMADLKLNESVELPKYEGRLELFVSEPQRGVTYTIS